MLNTYRKKVCMNSIVCLEQHICSYINFKFIHFLMWYSGRFLPYTSGLDISLLKGRHYTYYSIHMVERVTLLFNKCRQNTVHAP